MKDEQEVRERMEEVSTKAEQFFEIYKTTDSAAIAEYYYREGKQYQTIASTLKWVLEEAA